ncbi:MAG: 16S rRNA (cytidine(1402)-2'-O)-methyltransferase [Pseudomonadota bacterium]
MEPQNLESNNIQQDRSENPLGTGTLFIVATPLGNLEDMTFRAVNTLKQVDLIAAEDTRHSKKLLSHYGIKTRMISCHEHNEATQTTQLILQLKNGSSIALISDAGTPCISDPGYFLVKAASAQGILVIPIPGCSAAIAGLSVSGLPTDSFLFLGFLPKKQQQLNKALEQQKHQTPTLIIYESPNRITKLIQTMILVWGNRNACLAREATKLHEEYIRGPLSLILETLENKDRIKGEIALFVQGCSHDTPPMTTEMLEIILMDQLSSTDLSTTALARQIADQYQISKRIVYEQILNLQKRKK